MFVEFWICIYFIVVRLNYPCTLLTHRHQHLATQSCLYILQHFPV